MALLSFTILLCLSANVYALEGIVRTVAGEGLPHIGHVDTCQDGPASVDGVLANSRFNYPWGITYDPESSSIYVADCGCVNSPHSNDRIRQINLNQDIASTIAGGKQGFKDGSVMKSQFFHSAGLLKDRKQSTIYVADSGNDVIRAIRLSDMTTETIAGKNSKGTFVDGERELNRFNNPQQLEFWDDGNSLLVADTDNHAIRKINLVTKNVVTLTGGTTKKGFQDGSFGSAKFFHPSGMAANEKENILYVADHYNHAIRKLDFSLKLVSTIAGTGVPGTPEQSKGTGKSSFFHYPEGLALDKNKNILYVAEFGNNCIRGIYLSDNTVFVLAGSSSFGSRDAIGLDAQFYHPTDLVLDKENKFLYVSDQYNHRIRSVTIIGNQEEGSRVKMLADHVISKHAYTDVYVHHRWSTVIIFCVVLVAVISVWLLKRWPKYFKRNLL